MRRPGSYDYRVTLGRDPLERAVAHELDALAGPNDAAKEQRIIDGLHRELADRKRKW